MGASPIQAGFEQAVRGLGVIRKYVGFEKSEIERFEDLAAEARAATLSYLANIVDTVGTEEAARLQTRRLTRERRQRL